jgi:hypothetical protein
MEVLKPCWAVATSGVPVREQLFNVSICHYNHYNLFHHGDFSRSFGRTFDPSGLEVATPILLQRDDGHKHRRGSHGDIIFLTSRGEVSIFFAVIFCKCTCRVVRQGCSICREQFISEVIWRNIKQNVL